MSQSRFWVKDKTTQERWFRYKFYKKYGKKIRKLATWWLHKKLNKDFLQTDKIIENAIHVTVAHLKKIDKNLFPDTKNFFNICLYFLLAERDIQALKPDILVKGSDWALNEIVGKDDFDFQQDYFAILGGI